MTSLDYRFLREKYKEFVYHGFDFDGKNVVYHFSMGDIKFNPTWEFHVDSDPDDETLRRLLFDLGMAELVSYYKCACPPVIRTEYFPLDETQINFWKKLYLNGLGEFCYKNNIEQSDDFINIKTSLSTYDKRKINKSLDNILIPVGGGKDSIVTLELFKKHGYNPVCYSINPKKANIETAKTAELSLISAKRTIDPTLLKLNSEGYLNGHTPFSAVVAFSSLITAYLGGFKYIALSNESSADEEYVDGTSINHQYSKSTEFERDFRQYVNHSYLGAPEYFSLLRPWSEYKITSEFSKHDKYFNVFNSCNLGSKTDSWCKDCAKCLYIFIMLSAFLSVEKATKIIGKNMLDENLFSDMLSGLINKNHDKPFECVGTRDEIKAALYKAYIKTENPPILLEKFFPQFESGKDFTDKFNENNFVPEEFLKLLKD